MAVVTASIFSGMAMFANNPLRRRADAAEARVKSTKTQAVEAKRETNQKLLPDSVASILAQIAAPVTYGTWRNLYATGMAEQAAAERLTQRAGVALRVVGALTAAVSGVVAAMDVADSVGSGLRNQWGLAGLQFLSGAAGVAAAAFSFWAAVAIGGGTTVVAGLSLTGWGVILAVVLVALAKAIEHVQGDKFAQWLERTYWGKLESGRYTDPATQHADFNTAMAGA